MNVIAELASRSITSWNSDGSRCIIDLVNR